MTENFDYDAAAERLENRDRTKDVYLGKEEAHRRGQEALSRMGATRQNTSYLGLRLPDDLIARLRKTAAEDHRTPSAMARKILEDALKQAS